LENGKTPLSQFTPMTEYFNTKLEGYIRDVGNNFPTCLTLKIPSRKSETVFITFDGKVILDCRIFSSYASDGIFSH
jgi:hypothetical protein